jgi:hypothetical protein
LHYICNTVGSVLEGNPADKSAQSTGPICIRHECPQYRAAEELAAGSDLWGDSDLSQPPIMAGAAVGVIETSPERE